MKLTKANLQAIEAEFAASPKADRIIFDEDLPGFGLRLRKGSKHRSWVVQYEKLGIQRRITLGTIAVLSPDQARKAAKDELAKVQLGSDPQKQKRQEREKAKFTLHAIADAYLETRQPKLRPKTFTEVRRYLLRSWRTLHAMPIHRIERRDVAVALGSISRNSGATAAARARAALSSLFTWAMKEGLCDANPVALTNNPNEGAKPRERVLSDFEIAQVWNACRDDLYGCIVRLLILTGQRRDEVGAMAWAELDRDNGKWRIPGSRTKNHRDHELTLSAAAWAIIDTVPRRNWTDFLFGRGNHGFNGWATAKTALDKRSGVTAWTLHDLRRTVATRIADLNIAPPHVIEALLNHISGHKAGVAGIYNRSSYEREVRNALAAWADHIREITTGTEPVVVPMRRNEIPA